jgi:hypothetical protein
VPKARKKLLIGEADVEHCCSAKWEGLNKEQKFNVVYDKTLALQIRLANKLIGNLKRFECYTSEDYLETDDILQECSVLLWTLLNSYGHIPYQDFLRLYKTSIWKAVYLSGISKAKLKKNACLTAPSSESNPTLQDDILRRTDDVELVPVNSFDALFDKMDMEWIKEGFNKFISSVPTMTDTDKKIFNLIANPSDGFIDFCLKRNNSKKNTAKKIINNVNIAKFLDISPTGVGMSIKRITDTFSRYQRRTETVDNREVQEQEVRVREKSGV